MRRWTLASALACTACAQAFAHESEIRLLNPAKLFQPSTFSRLAVIGSGKLVPLSGQTARDTQSNIVGKGDVRAQTVQVFENLKVALQSVEVDFDDVRKLTTFVVGLKPGDRVMIAEVIAQYFPPGRRPAHTLVGIEALALEDLLIEIEAIAVVPP